MPWFGSGMIGGDTGRNIETILRTEPAASSTDRRGQDGLSDLLDWLVVI